MSRRVRLAIGAAAFIAVALLTALVVWAWYDQMEQVSQARYQQSEQLRDNPMLAATLLLQAHHYSVRNVPTLDELLRQPLPDGTLLLADQGGQMTPQQMAPLLQWVARGNTLIAVPQWAPHQVAVPAARPAPPGRPPGGGRTPLATLLEVDPLGTRYGIALGYHSKARSDCADAAVPAPATRKPNDDGDRAGDEDDAVRAAPANRRHIACIALDTPYPLALEADNTALDPAGDAAPQPLWSDSDGLAVRGYAEGRGVVVLMAHPYFGHADLRRYDHAELLLALARLHPGAGQFTIVRQLTLPTWYGALWRAAWPFLSALALLVALLLWRALRRFGPLLPQAAQPRRALLEHIDASGNWLWQASGGRELLLAAARGLTDDALRRRAPALAQLDLPQRIAELARRHAYPVADLQLALADAAASRPPTFTRQIALLQQLRTHYER